MKAVNNSVGDMCISMGTTAAFFQLCGLKPTINGRFIAFTVDYWGRKRGPANVLIGVREGFTWILFLSPFLSQPRQSLNDGHSDRVQALSERRVVLAAFFSQSSWGSGGRLA